MQISGPGQRGSQNLNAARARPTPTASHSVAACAWGSWVTSEATWVNGSSPAIVSWVTLPNWLVIISTAIPAR